MQGTAKGQRNGRKYGTHERNEREGQKVRQKAKTVFDGKILQRLQRVAKDKARHGKTLQPHKMNMCTGIYYIHKPHKHYKDGYRL